MSTEARLPPKPSSKAENDRKERLAQALRANLRRRKEQERGRGDEVDGDGGKG